MARMPCLQYDAFWSSKAVATPAQLEWTHSPSRTCAVNMRSRRGRLDAWWRSCNPSITVTEAIRSCQLYQISTTVLLLGRNCLASFCKCSPITTMFSKASASRYPLPADVSCHSFPGANTLVTFCNQSSAEACKNQSNRKARRADGHQCWPGAPWGCYCCHYRALGVGPNGAHEPLRSKVRIAMAHVDLIYRR